MLYTLITDSNYYLDPMIDMEQVSNLVGEISDETIDLHIELNNAPRSYKGVFKEPLRVNFPKGTKEQKRCIIPDICVFEGRLFLNQNAYEALAPLIEEDGEFLPIVYEEGNGYVYTPLRVAEDVDGIDMKLSRKYSWGAADNLVIHESKVKDWALFRTEFESYRGLHCQESVKDAIEEAGLKGLYITPELGRMFPVERSTVSKLQ